MKNRELPRGAAALVDVIGYRLGMALCATMNSGHLYVPIRLKPGHPIVGIVGQVAAEKLVGIYGGQTIRIPQCSAMQRAKRNDEIKVLAAEGVKVGDIARRFGMTAQAIRYVLKKQAPAL